MAFLRALYWWLLRKTQAREATMMGKLLAELHWKQIDETWRARSDKQPGSFTVHYESNYQTADLVRGLCASVLLMRKGDVAAALVEAALRVATEEATRLAEISRDRAQRKERARQEQLNREAREILAVYPQEVAEVLAKWRAREPRMRSDISFIMPLRYSLERYDVIYSFDAMDRARQIAEGEHPG